MADPKLRTYELSDGILYGPVQSRRMGVSLGLNILPAGIKLCSFNCIYCQCGWSTRRVDEEALARHRFPPAREVAETLFARLAEFRAAGENLDSITFSGNGEPTLHPDFLGVVKAVLEVRDRAMPGTRVDILSNSAHLGRPGVIEGLNLLDERHMKLDAGREEGLRGMNMPLVEVRIEDLIRDLGRLRDFHLQAMFARGRWDNTGPEDVEAWIEVVRRLKPRAVHLYSVDRVPADAGVLGVDRAGLEEIARRVEERAGVPAKVY
jgi:wyosine [tRNA(Phe)-imidazoG37] synthetase (radical SAM superfamily)